MKIDKRHIEIIDNTMAKVFRGMTPQQRLAITFKMWNSARIQLTGYLSYIHPDWEEERIKREVARRLSHGAT